MTTVNLKNVLYTRSDDGVDYEDVASLTDDDILRKVFRTKEDAYDFYQKLERFHGFGIRKGDMFKDGGGNLIRRRLFCNREGFRHRKHYNRVDRMRLHKPETRINCESRMCINLDRSNNIWRVKKVIMKHNHALTHLGMVHLIPNFWSMIKAAKAQIDGMQGCGISTSKTMQYLVGMAGGYSLVGFLKKDAYNYVDRSRPRIADEDANSAIVSLEEKVDTDLMSMAWYNVTVDDMLAKLLWADGGSRLDYQYFGDVLAFNSTYKKNKYNRLLVIFLLL
ncbi:protein FAR1-RELATED SEQUENCE 5-like [Arachis stenosperma]|uniref:protein FAR1-RELATED SEQUENCE 5-like n=1 Tax=Arachis stenosperma TaxID=217475 RepID=UPI0025ABCBBA|nr:protein FAR1-RELATED SEQUENCE 5-like [Arachis stenosperma]